MTAIRRLLWSLQLSPKWGGESNGCINAALNSVTKPKGVFFVFLFFFKFYYFGCVLEEATMKNKTFLLSVLSSWSCTPWDR